MKFQKEMRRGIILKRYKRFLADIQLEGEERPIVAHVPNTGSMKTCWEAGQKVLCSYENNPKRKLQYTLQMTHNGESWIMVNTSATNDLAVEAIENGTISELLGYQKLKREVKVGNSRIDILLDYGRERPCYVEVKNVTLAGEERAALFPDAVSERGQKHLRELMALVNGGKRGCMLYVVNRDDVGHFAPAESIDPVYASLLRQAAKVGVEILAYQSQLNSHEVTVAKKMDVEL